MQTDAARTKKFEAIVERYQRRLISIACRMLGNLEEARDVAQEAFVRFWRSGTVSLDEGSPFGFLVKAVTNLCVDELRRRKRFKIFDLRSAPTALVSRSRDNPERRTGDRETLKLVMKAAERLKPKQKAVFVLRDFEGFSVKETAEIVGCSENNVLASLYYARRNMRKWLGPVLR